jgi:diguanylate cyclase
VIASLREPVRVGEHTFGIAASIGISVYPDDGEDQEVLVQRADAAMYLAKRSESSVAFASTQQVSGIASPAADTRDAIDPIGLLDVALADAHTTIANLKSENSRLVLDALTAEQERDKSAQAAQHQSQLLNIVAHELRNSLSPLQSAADVLGLLHTDASLMPRIEMILRRQISHMTTLLTDLLDVSRSNMGRLAVTFHRTDVAVVADGAVSRARPGMARRQQVLQLLVESPSPFVMGDASRLTQVVTTLLDRVSINLPEGAMVTVSVYERNLELVIAIAEGDAASSGHDDVAEPFSVSDASPASLAERDGLALSFLVVIELVKSHRGRLTFGRLGESQRMRFQISLPSVD